MRKFIAAENFTPEIKELLEKYPVATGDFIYAYCVGGIVIFDTWDDFEIWQNQK